MFCPTATRHELSRAHAPKRLHGPSVRLRRPPGQHGLGRRLRRERRAAGPGPAACRRRARRARPSAGTSGTRSGTAARPSRGRRRRRALLGGLRHGVHVTATAPHGDERGRRREVACPRGRGGRPGSARAVPRRGFERDEAVGEEVVAVPVGAVEVEGGRSGRHVDDPAPSSSAMPAQLLAPPLTVRASAGHVS